MSSIAQVVPDTRGRYGPYGGRYVPETLMAPLEELERAYAEARANAAFRPNSTTSFTILPAGPRRCSLPRA